MLRSLPRAASTSSATLLATRRPFLTASTAACPHAIRRTTQQTQTRRAHAHAVSNPTLAGIEKRWEAMPPQEQAELWMALRDRMKADWHELTLQEKKAGMILSLSSCYSEASLPGGLSVELLLPFQLGGFLCATSPRVGYVCGWIGMAD